MRLTPFFAPFLVPFLALVLSGCGLVNTLIPPIEIGGWFTDQAIVTGEPVTFSTIPAPTVPDLLRLRITGLQIDDGQLDAVVPPAQPATSDACGVSRLDITLEIAQTGQSLQPFFSGRVNVNPATCALVGSSLTIVSSNRTVFSNALSGGTITLRATASLFNSANQPVAEAFTLSFSGMRLNVGL